MNVLDRCEISGGDGLEAGITQVSGEGGPAAGQGSVLLVTDVMENPLWR